MDILHLKGGKLKNKIKNLIRYVAYIHAWYYIVLVKILKFNFKTVSILISKIPGKYGVFLRQNYYKNLLKKCGTNLEVGYGSFFVYRDAEVGNNCAIEEYSIISLCKIGNDVIVAARCSLMSGGNHHETDNLNVKFRESILPLKKIEIGNNVWIGTHSVIMNNVSSHSIVGAGSVVTKTYPEYSIIAGVPAKLIRKRGER